MIRYREMFLWLGKCRKMLVYVGNFVVDDWDLYFF